MSSELYSSQTVSFSQKRWRFILNCLNTHQ